MNVRTIRILGTLALSGLLGGIAAGSAVADPTTPTGRVSDIRSVPGQLSFTFTASGVPSGTSIDPASMSVTVNGEPLKATATSFEVLGSGNGAVTREVILTLDVSGSMKGAGISAARSAATAYAKELPADVRVGLITFSTTPTILLRPTTDRQALATAIAKVQAGGSTALYDGVASAVTLLQALPSSAQRRILVLSDGNDSSSQRTLSQLLTTLRSAHIPADVVAFRLPGKHQVLDDIATASHGAVLPAGDTSALARAFAVAAQAFGQRVHVDVTVPQDLDKKVVTFSATIKAGADTIAATGNTKLIGPGFGGTQRPISTVSSVHDPGLLIVLGIAFVGILAAGLLLLLGPTIRNERAAWKARVAEAGRYRVVRVVRGEGEANLPALPGGEEGAVSKRALAMVDRAVRARGQRERLVSELERAGLRMRPEEWAVLQLAVVLAAAAVFFVFTRSVLGVIIGGVIGWILCRVFIRVKIDRRAKDFEDQLADNLQLLAGSLRSGFSLAQALGTVVREGTEPTASEYTRAITEVRLGADLEDALERTADRMRCEDLRWVVMAIRIAREVGGNLAEVLDGTVETMRERARLRGQVRVLTAEGRLSARILTALPIFVGGLFVLIRPTYVHPLFHTTSGLILFSIGVLELILGAVWLNRLTKIEV